MIMIMIIIIIIWFVLSFFSYLQHH
jgi:hypothetical protein